ncbi:unnamed protein product [Peniophora sp. CBMAI 1063]|nr:unnamed protein product [Peniophora sp. CBMAI 1063]
MLEESDGVQPVFAKKYKPVARKVRPVLDVTPERFRVERKITGDPLAGMPPLNPNPPPFEPRGRYTEERKAVIDRLMGEDFLLPDERAVMHEMMRQQEAGFAWDDSERGTFRTDFFPPVQIPVVPHKPWVERNIPIPPGIYDEVCALIKRKLDAGVYEPSNSSYRGKWFCVVKKDGKSLRLVHSLEPLNKVTIAHSGVPPFTEQIAEQFAGRACGGVLDLYVGYDERLIDKASRDYTSFQTPFGVLRLVTLPMGWTNSVPIFHEDVTFILQAEIPHVTVPFIDDAPLRGPPTRYLLEDGSEERIAENPGVRRFVWEHLVNVNRVIQRMKYAGGTFSGPKALIIAEDFVAIGHRCTPAGRLPEKGNMAKVEKWLVCRTASEIKAFMGTVGVGRVFIKDYGKRSLALVKLTRKGQPFVWGPEQKAALEDLKAALLSSPALMPIDYVAASPVILGVDTSLHAVGYFLAQEKDIPGSPQARRYARFGSILLNARESRFSQPKLELYGLFRAFKDVALWLVGVRNLVVEVDAQYIEGMLKNPEILPAAATNRWALSIKMFHFELRHVPGERHVADGMSRRLCQPGEEGEGLAGENNEADEEWEDWIDHVYGFIHLINPPPKPLFSRRVHAQEEILVLAQAAPPPRDIRADAPALDPPLDYSEVPRRHKWAAMDDMLPRVLALYQESTYTPPTGYSDAQVRALLRFAGHFFVSEGRLFRRDADHGPRIVVFPSRRLQVLLDAHDNLAHHGVHAVAAMLSARFWWPGLAADVAWYVRSCHLCQIRQLAQPALPISVALPANLFSKVHMDVFHFSHASRGFKRAVHARCALSSYPEAAPIRETGAALGEWIFTNLLCRWGAIQEIVSDNGKAFVAAVDYLAKKYHIHYIRISGYNSRANAVAERGHLDFRQGVYKAADGDESKWAHVLPTVLWAERITPRRRLGCSPYFMVTGTEPVMPFDLLEATYLVPAPSSLISSAELLARRAVALQKRTERMTEISQKVYKARIANAQRFEKAHKATLDDRSADAFTRGHLVLVRNSMVEKSLNKRQRPRYYGPLVVISRNRGGAFILCELDGTVLHRPVAAFRVIPYIERRRLDRPPLPSELDISEARLAEMEDTADVDPEVTATTRYLEDITGGSLRARMAEEGQDEE